MDFGTFIAEDRRLLILRLLAGQGDFILNDGLLLHGLEALGHGVSRQQLHRDLHWLMPHSLIALTSLSPQILRVQLLEKGHELTTGKRRIEGIRRLRPDEVV